MDSDNVERDEEIDVVSIETDRISSLEKMILAQSQQIQMLRLQMGQMQLLANNNEALRNVQLKMMQEHILAEADRRISLALIASEGRQVDKAKKIEDFLSGMNQYMIHLADEIQTLDSSLSLHLPEKAPASQQNAEAVQVCENATQMVRNVSDEGQHGSNQLNDGDQLGPNHRNSVIQEGPSHLNSVSQHGPSHPNDGDQLGPNHRNSVIQHGPNHPNSVNQHGPNHPNSVNQHGPNHPNDGNQLAPSPPNDGNQPECDNANNTVAQPHQNVAPVKADSGNKQLAKIRPKGTKAPPEPRDVRKDVALYLASRSKKDEWKKHLKVVNVNDNVLYVCLKCNYKSKHRSYIQVHIKSMHLEDKHLCPFCLKTFKYKRNVSDHIDNQHSMLDKHCHHCDFNTMDHRELFRHFNIRHGILNPYEVLVLEQQKKMALEDK